MGAKPRSLAAALLGGIAVLAFFAGRQIEQRALLVRAHASAPTSVQPAVTEQPPAPRYWQLAVADILGLSFAEFYEALRDAPGEARQHWATELMTMPEGPRRTAAVSAFYKLLVQFDPVAAIKAIREIEDVRLQTIALGAAVNAAPGFALPGMAELSLSLQERTATKSKRDYLSDVLQEWMLIDAPAVVQFIDSHPAADNLESYNMFGIRQLLHYRLISVWAELDPKAAKQWMEKNGDWDTSVREEFVEGWFENDRGAAVSYVLANADDPGMRGEIGVVVRGFYSRSKEEAAKFIESLPADKRRDALTEAFRRLVLGDEKETGDTVFTQRAVASWLIEFPPEYWKGTIGGIFGATGGADDMLEWIQQLPPDRRELVADEYNPPYFNSTFEKITGVLQVPDPILRDKLFRAALRNYDQTLREAREAIGITALTSEQKNYFLQIIAAVEAEKEKTDQGSEK